MPGRNRPNSGRVFLKTECNIAVLAQILPCPLNFVQKEDMVMVVYIRTQGTRLVKEGRHLLVKKDKTVFNIQPIEGMAVRR
jgi:hypothetical protein